MARFTTSGDWHGIYRRTYDQGAWKSGHSNTTNNYRIYHGGTSDNAGYYNGNMMTLISMSKIKEGINSRGVSWDRVDRVRLRIYCDWCFNHGAGAYVGIRACDNAPTGKTTTSLSGLGMTTIINSTKVYENHWYEYDIPISTAKNYAYIAFYTPGKYNSSSYYTYFNADEGVNHSSKHMSFIVDYTDKVIPGKPDVGLRGYSGEKIGCDFNGMTNVAVFKGNNDIEVYSDHASNAVKTELHLQWRDKTRDWRYCGGYPYTTNGAVKKTRHYGNSDRYAYGEFNEQYFCAWTVAVSKTGHKTRSDYFYFAINDLPSISNDISVSSKITPDEITVSWKDWSDRLNKKGDPNQWFRLWFRIYRNGTWTDYSAPLDSVRNAFSKTFNLSDIGVNRGEKVRIWVEPGDYQEWSGTKYGYAEVTRNTIPFFSSTASIDTSVNSSLFNNVFADCINVSLPKANDPDDQDIKYKLYYYAPTVNSNWNYIATYNDLNINSLDIGQYVSNGQSLTLGVIANDGLEDSPLPMPKTPVMKKNVKPPKITGFNITSYNHEDGDKNYERIDSIRWDNMQQFNGNNMNKYIIKMHACRRSDGQVYDTRTYESSQNYLESLDFGMVRRGDIFKFEIISVDSYSYQSDSYISPEYYKNSAPSDPRNFRTVGTTNYFKDIVNLTWEPSTDVDNDVIRYELYFSKNRGAYTLLDANIAITSYAHNISSLQAGDVLGYKIIARDEYGVKSNEVYVLNNNNLFVNIPPAKANIQYPLANKEIYVNKPRVIINIPSSNRNTNLTAYVTLNGTTYVSSSATTCFNKQFYSPGDYVVFTPNVNLLDGANQISVILSDGLDQSSGAESTILYRSPTLSRLGSDSFLPVSVDVYEKLKDMVNKNRVAYGQTANADLTPIKNEVKVYAKYFTDLYYKLLEVNKILNERYPGLNRNHPIFPSITGPVSKNMYNIIHDLITNL